MIFHSTPSIYAYRFLSPVQKKFILARVPACKDSHSELLVPLLGPKGAIKIFSRRQRGGTKIFLRMQRGGDQKKLLSRHRQTTPPLPVKNDSSLKLHGPGYQPHGSPPVTTPMGTYSTTLFMKKLAVDFTWIPRVIRELCLLGCSLEPHAKPHFSS